MALEELSVLVAVSLAMVGELAGLLMEQLSLQIGLLSAKVVERLLLLMIILLSHLMMSTSQPAKEDTPN